MHFEVAHQQAALDSTGPFEKAEEMHPELSRGCAEGRVYSPASIIPSSGKVNEQRLSGPPHRLHLLEHGPRIAHVEVWKDNLVRLKSGAAHFYLLQAGASWAAVLFSRGWTKGWGREYLESCMSV